MLIKCAPSRINGYDCLQCSLQLQGSLSFDSNHQNRMSSESTFLVSLAIQKAGKARWGEVDREGLDPPCRHEKIQQGRWYRHNSASLKKARGITSSPQMLSPVSLISPACQAAKWGRQRADTSVWLNTLLLYLHAKTGVKTLSQDPHDGVSSSVAQRGFVRPDYKLLPRTSTNHLPEKTIVAKQLLSIGLHSRIQQLSGYSCYPQVVIWFHTGVSGWSSSSDYSIYFPLD